MLSEQVASKEAGGNGGEAPSRRGFTYRVTAQRTILVTWPQGSLGYSTELGIRYEAVPTARGDRYETVLFRMFGAELPSDVFDWVIAEAMALGAGEIADQLNARTAAAVAPTAFLTLLVLGLFSACTGAADLSPDASVCRKTAVQACGYAPIWPDPAPLYTTFNDEPVAILPADNYARFDRWAIQMRAWRDCVEVP